jgi:hypothetical protein
MINGEDIIGEEVKADSGFYELKNPANLVLQRSETGMGVAIAPFMPYATGNIKLFCTGIAAECDPDQSLINEYNRIFGTGILVPPPQKIIT